MRAKTPTMTRAHFQYLAEWVRYELPVEADSVADGIQYRDTIARSLARSLVATNGQFNSDRFLRACGVGE